jgi:hypothetical protein
MAPREDGGCFVRHDHRPWQSPDPSHCTNYRLNIYPSLMPIPISASFGYARQLDHVTLGRHDAVARTIQER